MRVTRCLTVLLGAAAVLAGTLAGAQSPRVGPQRATARTGPGGPRMFGTVISADIAAGTIEAEVLGRRVTLYPIRATNLLTRQEMKIDELVVGDPITVTGLPTKLTADRVTADKALQPEPVDVEPPPADVGEQSAAGRAAYASVSGKVASTKPLRVSVTVVGPDGHPADLQVEVSVADGAVVSKLVPGQWTEVREGVSFEFTLQDDDWQKMVLGTMVLNAGPSL